MNNLRNKLGRFLQGRYGNDPFNRFLMGLCFVFIILSMFFGGYTYFAALVVLVYGYYRMLSKNFVARYKENEMYLKYTKGIRAFINTNKLRFQCRKTHHIYVCSNCRQNIRIPKGKGKISITCPRCKNQFIKVS